MNWEEDDGKVSGAEMTPVRLSGCVLAKPKAAVAAPKRKTGRSVAEEMVDGGDGRWSTAVDLDGVVISDGRRRGGVISME